MRPAHDNNSDGTHFQTPSSVYTGGTGALRAEGARVLISGENQSDRARATVSVQTRCNSRVRSSRKNPSAESEPSEETRNRRARRPSGRHSNRVVNARRRRRRDGGGSTRPGAGYETRDRLLSSECYCRYGSRRSRCCYDTRRSQNARNWKINTASRAEDREKRVSFQVRVKTEPRTTDVSARRDRNAARCNRTSPRDSKKFACFRLIVQNTAKRYENLLHSTMYCCRRRESFFLFSGFCTFISFFRVNAYLFFYTCILSIHLNIY